MPETQNRADNSIIAPWIAVAIGLLLTAIVSYFLFYERGWQAARQEAIPAANSSILERCSTQPSNQEAQACYDHAEREAIESGRASRELLAIEAASTWTQAMVWATISIGCITMIITGLGVYFVRKTLVATLTAVKTAQDANSILQSDQRPWVTIERELDCEFLPGQRNAQLSWRYRLINRGRMPAQRVHLSQVLCRYETDFDRSAQYESFVNKSILKATQIVGKVVFPDSDTPVTGAFIGSMLPSQGEHHALFVCVTYVHSNGIVGIDSQMLEIEQNQNVSIGPRMYRLILHGSERVIQ